MAGNESDLLKQATQAMMARYEGEYLFPFPLGHFCMTYTAFCSDFCCRMLDAMDICTDLSIQDCAAVFLSLSSLVDDVFSTCLNVQVDEEGSLPAVIGVCLSKPQSVTEHVQKRTQNRTWLFLQFLHRKKEFFGLLSLGLYPCVNPTFSFPNS